MSIITLEEAWKILESLNDDANQCAKSIWESGNEKEAILKQSFYFRDIFLNLNNELRQLIVYWVEHDDEFQDYFKCLSGDEQFYKCHLKI
jgi:hypothetical protein